MSFSNQGNYILVQLSLQITDQIFAVVTSLYIWQHANLSTLLLFWAIQSLASVLTFIFSGWGTDTVGPLFVLRVGVIATLIQACLLLWFPTNILSHIVPYSLLVAISSALVKFPQYPINQHFASQSKERSFYGVLSAYSQILSILFPIISGLIISLAGYTLLFAIAVASSLAAWVMSFRLAIAHEGNTFDPLGLFRPFSIEKKVNVTVDFFWGMESGILTPFLPIATILVLGSINYWGLFTSFAALLSLWFSYVYAKHNSEHLSVGLVSIFALLLSACAIAFSASTSFWTFVLYVIMLKLWQTVQTTGVNYILDTAIQAKERRPWMSTELGLLSWIPFMAGRGIFLLLLLPFAPLLSGKLAIGVLFALAGFFVLQQQVTAMLSRKFTLSAVE